MSTYTTVTAASAAVLLNMDFEEVASVSKAKAFISAAKAWLFLTPESASDSSSAVTVGRDQLRKDISRAQDYVDAFDIDSAAGSKVSYFDMSGPW